MRARPIVVVHPSEAIEECVTDLADAGYVLLRADPKCVRVIGTNDQVFTESDVTRLRQLPSAIKGGGLVDPGTALRFAEDLANRIEASLRVAAAGPA